MAEVWRPLPDVRDHIERIFPRLTGTCWRPKSPQNDGYNCFAWGACDSTQWWEPHPLHWYWPIAEREYSIPNFVEAFRARGFEPCGLDSSFEIGYQKIAIYADEDEFPTHIARQHLLGIGWLSKLGPLEDIFHRRLHDLEGSKARTSQEYGEVALILKRSWRVGVRHGMLDGIRDAKRFRAERRRQWS